MDERTLTAIIAALEVAATPVTAKHWPDLGDPAIRAEIDRRLRRNGRQLLTVDLDGHDHAAVGYISGYDDAVADHLAQRPRPGLTEQDLAVLATVLLHGVLLPRADGRLPGSSWATGLPVARERLHNRHLRDRQVDESLTRLRAAGLLGRSNTPGPALWRLSPQRQTLLWENVVLLCRPGGALAAEIRRRRAQRAAAAPTVPPSGDTRPPLQEARS